MQLAAQSVQGCGTPTGASRSASRGKLPARNRGWIMRITLQPRAVERRRAAQPSQPHITSRPLRMRGVSVARRADPSLKCQAKHKDAMDLACWNTPAGTTARPAGPGRPNISKLDVTVGQVGVQSRQHLPSIFAPALSIKGRAGPSGLQASLVPLTLAHQAPAVPRLPCPQVSTSKRPGPGLDPPPLRPQGPIRSSQETPGPPTLPQHRKRDTQLSGGPCSQRPSHLACHPALKPPAAGSAVCKSPSVPGACWQSGAAK